MATHTIVTTARQEEALARLLLERNRERARAGQSALPDVQALIRAEFATQFAAAVDRLGQVERPRVADAYDQADVAVRAQVRALLGVE